jgi:class 3 adenylate cyclase
MTLPTGTVTFLFTDIEGSTRLLQQLGDRYGEVVAEHRRLLRESFREAGGQEIDTQGDAFFYSFTRAREAVVGAVAGQRALAAHAWPEGVEVLVRMGLHTGEPAVGDEGYLGLDVHRAARICAAAQGGQILVSETTRALLGPSLPDGLSVDDLGEHRLKDMEHAERVFQLTVPGLRSSFPSPRTSAGGALAPLASEQRAQDLAAKATTAIDEYVTRQIEEAFAGRPPSTGPGESPSGLLKLTLIGLGSLVALAVTLVLLVVLVRAVF